MYKSLIKVYKVEKNLYVFNISREFLFNNNFYLLKIYF